MRPRRIGIQHGNHSLPNYQRDCGELLRFSPQLFN
jgi:hypothetical protein